jgi:YfiH family protein
MTTEFSLTLEPDALFSSIPLDEPSLGRLPGGAASCRLRAGLSLARAGDMALARRLETPDRARLLDSAGIPAERAVGLHQVHSKRVIVVDHQEPQSLAAKDADGLVTSRCDVFLTVTVADCLPIFLVDRRTGAFGLVHSGWKGTGIVVEALQAMAEAFGTKAQDVAAVMGPGIGPCCYAVPRERYEQFRTELGEDAEVRGASGDYRLDLKAANLRLMQSAGVERIAVATECTCCSPSLGSFRREGQGFRRMLAFIGPQGVVR